MKSILNLNKRIEERRLKEFEETAKKAAEEIDGILIKYGIKIVPYIMLNHFGNSPLISGLNAGFTFSPLSQTEKESIELQRKMKQAKELAENKAKGKQTPILEKDEKKAD